MGGFFKWGYPNKTGHGGFMGKSDDRDLLWHGPAPRGRMHGLDESAGDRNFTGKMLEITWKTHENVTGNQPEIAGNQPEIAGNTCVPFRYLEFRENFSCPVPNVLKLAVGQQAKPSQALTQSWHERGKDVLSSRPVSANISNTFGGLMLGVNIYRYVYIYICIGIYCMGIYI